MLEATLSRKGTCSAGEKEEEMRFAGEKEEDSLKESENTWEKGRVHVRGREQLRAQVRNTLVARVFNPYPG